MNVKVSYFGHLRSKAGIKYETVKIASQRSVGDLLEPLCRRRHIHQDVFGQPDSDGVKPSVNILLNGRNIKFLDGLDTPLNEGDEVSIFPPTGGG